MSIKSSRFLCAFAAAALAIAATSPSQADERDDLLKKKQEQERQIENYKSSLEGVNTNLQKVYLDLQQTQAQIPVAEAELKTAKSELAAATRQQEAVAGQLQAAQSELSSIEKEVRSGEKTIAVTRKDLGTVARAEYRGDALPSTWDLMVGSRSSEDFYNSVSATRAAFRKQTAALQKVQQKTATARNRQARQSAVRKRVAQLKSEADALVADKASKQAAAESKAKQLSALKTTYTTQSQQLEAQKGQFQASIQEVNTARDATASQIAAIDAENRRKAQAAAAAAQAEARKNSAKNAPAAPAQPQQPAGGGGGAGQSVVGGGFLIPVIPRPLQVTSPFGMRYYPFGGYYMHNGVDLRSRCGQAQVAAGDGVVAKTVPAPGNSTHGNQVFLNLGVVNGHSWVVVTNHMSGFAVSAGQTVKKGQLIGWTGQTGQVTGCHVHMEVWRDGKVVNPMSLPGF